MHSTEQLMHHKLEAKKLLRFFYLNSYSFLLLFCGAVILCLPAYKVSYLMIAPQILFSIFFIKQSYNLFSTWGDKKVKYEILLGRNKKQFRPNTFKVYMDAPCGRLIVKEVLKDLGMSTRYSELLAYKTPLIEKLKNGFKKQEYHVYINEDF